MNIKAKLIRDLKSDEAKSESFPFQIDSSESIDVKMFWKLINYYYFTSNPEEDEFKINHLITKFANNGNKF